MKKNKMIKVTGLEKSLDGFLDDTKRLYDELGLGNLFDSSTSDKRHIIPPKVKVLIGSW